MSLNSINLRKGDEVITPPNSFISSTSSIIHIGARPVFVDVLPDQNINPELIERSITKKTKAIFLEVLANPGGIVVDLEEIVKIANEAEIPVIVDNTMASPFLSPSF